MRKKIVINPKKRLALLLAGAFFLLFSAKIGYFAKAEEKINISVQNMRIENPYGWEKMSAYTTYFNQNEGGRCENIAIAAALIDGVTIQP